MEKMGACGSGRGVLPRIQEVHLLGAREPRGRHWVGEGGLQARWHFPVGVGQRLPGQLEDAKDAFLMPITPGEKLGWRRSISAGSCLLLIRQII